MQSTGDLGINSSGLIGGMTMQKRPRKLTVEVSAKKQNYAVSKLNATLNGSLIIQQSKLGLNNSLYSRMSK